MLDGTGYEDTVLTATTSEWHIMLMMLEPYGEHAHGNSALSN